MIQIGAMALGIASREENFKITQHADVPVCGIQMYVSDKHFAFNVRVLPDAGTDFTCE
jgi:hypothetical protein